jgi:hypothetical protein
MWAGGRSKVPRGDAPREPEPVRPVMSDPQLFASICPVVSRDWRERPSVEPLPTGFDDFHP